MPENVTATVKDSTNTTSGTATILLDGKSYELPVVVGSENEKAIDISKLRDISGYITLDIGYKNTGLQKEPLRSCTGRKEFCDTADTRLRTLPKNPLSSMSLIC
jgi:hypothetical protein